MALPKIVADFETSLTAKIAIGGTTGTIASNVDDDGVTLADGQYYFTLDGNNSAKEHIRCTKTGTALTDIYSYSRQGVATSGTVREHRVGAKVIMTDYATYKNYFEASVLTGPGSSTDNAIVRWDSTTGQILKNSGVIVDNSNNIYVPGTLDLGHASDTTISRVSSGVVAVEGKNIALNGTSEVLTTGTIELGAASDTTIARVSAGVISVEGVTIPSILSTNTLTNKRVTPRITTITSHATPTINTDDCDTVTITAQAEAITSMTTNLSGTPTNFQKLIIRIKDNGTARAITWGASFEAKGVALPTTTVLSKVLTVGFIYDTVTSKWGCVASAQEA